jgi:hypothetical protein
MCYPVASAVIKTSIVAPTVGQAALGAVIREVIRAGSLEFIVNNHDGSFHVHEIGSL